MKTIEIGDILNSIPKKRRRNANTVKYGMFGLSLGPETYARLDEYCFKHNIKKTYFFRII